jgi:serine phosphatase RsbU (regulator of sigma subunit)
LRPGEGLSGRVYLTGEPQIVNDYDRWEGRSSQYGPGTFAHSMAAPLRAGGKAIGVLAVDRHADELPFTDDDLRLLTLFANQASVAVTNAHLYEQAQHRSRELSHLYDTSLDITAKLDLNDVLEAVIRRTTELVEAQQGEVLVYDEERGLATSFLSLGLQEVGLPADIHVSGRPPAGLDGMVIDERRPVRVDDYDTWDGRLDSPPRGLIGPMIGVPILHQGRILGSLSLARGRAARPFSDEDEQRLVLFANQAAVAIANARQVEQLEEFHAQQIEKERLDQQLRTARAVQAGLLPAEIPVIPGWDIAAVWRPALQLGGDCYDVIPLAPERWGLLMADVSDKGIPAALLMAVTHSLFRVYASAELSPRETLARVNRDLVATSHSGMFVTAVYAGADTSTGEVRVAGAGHPPALVVRHPGRHVDAIRVGGMPLGIEEETAFDEETIHLHPGEEIVLYTDGVTEAGDDAGGLFGAARLEAALHLGAGASAGQRIAELEDAVRRFAGEVPASDDVACLVLRREPARDGEPGVDYGR